MAEPTEADAAPGPLAESLHPGRINGAWLPGCQQHRSALARQQLSLDDQEWRRTSPLIADHTGGQLPLHSGQPVAVMSSAHHGICVTAHFFWAALRQTSDCGQHLLCCSTFPIPTHHCRHSYPCHRCHQTTFTQSLGQHTAAVPHSGVNGSQPSLKAASNTSGHSGMV